MKRKSTSGVALIIVLWAIFAISAATIVAMSLVKFDLQLESAAAQRLAARQAALTGLALASHPKVEAADPLLSQTLDDSRFDVYIENEDARLNINALLQGPNTDDLQRLFRFWGVPEKEAAAAADSLKDWADPDKLRSLHGAEANDIDPKSPYSLPANRPFRSVSEMEAVRGMDAVAAAKPDWMNFFSVRSSGKIDVQQAPADLFEVFGGLNSEQARTIVEYRAGPDRKPLTADDPVISSPAALSAIVALSEIQKAAVEKYFGVDSPIKRIHSIGSAGSVRHEIVVICAKDRNRGVNSEGGYLEWSEN